jgi:hypothetical protein
VCVHACVCMCVCACFFSQLVLMENGKGSGSIEVGKFRGGVRVGIKRWK